MAGRWLQQGIGGAVIYALFALPVSATAPETSIRPMARPSSALSVGTFANLHADLTNIVVAAVMGSVIGANGLPIRPPLRPAGADTQPVAFEPTSDTRTQAQDSTVSPYAVARSLRPRAMSQQARRAFQRRVAVASVAAALSVTRARSSGNLCGQPGIAGETLSRIRSSTDGCGIADPVRVTAIDGITLSTPATLHCDTARALQTWLSDGVGPAIGRTGGGLVGLRVIGHYSCRTRNNRPGARISEHGRGRAIDIAGFQLANGTEVTVLRQYTGHRNSDILHRIHRAACGIFGTTIGPGSSDGQHQDHFHYDTATYRSGSYCH
jgi:hypothetical protein